MRYLKEILKSIAVFALGLVGLFGLFSEPDQDSEHWLSDVVMSKTIAVASFAAIGVITYKNDK